MKNVAGMAAIVSAIVLTVTTAAVAAPPKAKAGKAAAAGKTAAATLKCPACGMPMPMKKSAMTPVPVKVAGKTYYCCAGCPAGKKAMAAMKGAGAAKTPTKMAPAKKA